MNQEKIGKFIAEHRKMLDMTQMELAEKLNVSTNAVSKWERGVCLMDMSLLKPLSEILGVSINEILNGEEIKDDELKKKTDEVLNNTINYSNKKIKRIKKIILVPSIIVIFLVFVLTFTIDYHQVKENKNPIFMILVNERGNNYTYSGFGYQMKKEVSISPYEPLYNSQRIQFGFWLFTWDMPIYNVKPYNLWVINGEKRLLTNIGSYCITDKVYNRPISECVDSIPIQDFTFNDQLNVKKNDMIILDRSDVYLMGIKIYNINGLLIDSNIDYDNNYFIIPDLKGEYLVSLATNSNRGKVWYNFKMKVE